jgi:hypothetical protein
VEDGNAEDGHDRIADELLHRAAVPLQDGAHLLEVAAQDPTKRLRVEAFTEGGRAGDVGENDGDCLPNVPLDRSARRKRRRAGQAEPRELRVLLAAGAANGHTSSL